MNDQSLQASEWIDVSDARDFEDGKGRDIVVDAQVIAVFRIDNRWYAIDGLCAHQGGPVAEGTLHCDAEGRVCVTCPWHGWQYELETGIQTINGQPLQQTFPIREVDGKVQIKLKRD